MLRRPGKTLGPPRLCYPANQHREASSKSRAPTNVAQNLRDCSDNLDRRIKAIDEKKEKANKDIKNSLNELRTRLVKEKSKVDRSLKDIERSTEDRW